MVPPVLLRSTQMRPLQICLNVIGNKNELSNHKIKDYTNMTKIIFIAGAPGSGKTTISNQLKIELDNCPLIDFGWIREFHLNETWSNASDKEEQMSFENLVFILKNYIKNEYPYVIVNDLLDKRVLEIPKIFDQANYLIFSLVVNDDNELSNRVLDETRDSGFRNVDEALKWNKKLMERDSLMNEFKIDNSSKNPGDAIKIILQKIDDSQ
jgi:adenylate kinase family enzyme